MIVRTDEIHTYDIDRLLDVVSQIKSNRLSGEFRCKKLRIIERNGEIAGLATRAGVKFEYS